MAERRIIKGWIVERQADGTLVPIAPADGGGQPPADPGFQYEGPKAQADLTSTTLTNQQKQQELEDTRRGKLPTGYRWGANGQAELIPGVPAPAKSPSQIATEGEAKRAAVIQKLMGDVRGLYQRDIKGGWPNGISGNVPSLLRPQNEEFNAAANGILPLIRPLVAQTAKEGDSDKEMEVFMSYIPRATDNDNTIERKLNMLETLIGGMTKGAAPSMTDQAVKEGRQPIAAAQQYAAPGRNKDAAASFLSNIGGPNGSNGGPSGGPSFLPTAKGARPDPGIEADGVVAKARGGFTQVPSLRGIDQAVIDMVAGGRSAPEIVKFLDDAYRATETEHGGSLRVSPGLADFVGGIVADHRAAPDKPIRSLGQQWEILSGYETPDKEQSFLGALASPGDWGGYAADTNPGNFAMTAANAATAGLPAYLAGDKGNAVMAASRLERPKTSFAGEVIGGAAGMTGANRVLGSLGRIGAGAARFGGGLVTDVGYGATRGGLENGPMGAAVGALAAGGGNVVGRYGVAPAGRAILDTTAGQALANTVKRGVNAAGNAGRGLFGRNPTAYQPANIPGRVSGAERSVQARLPDDVLPQLQEAQRLNMPLALADTSPELQALTGSVVRKSADARNMAADVLRPRSLGQADRARQQITDNFGAVDNPNEISDQLLQQARQNAAPLYDAFRSQPARTSPQLESMLGTPAGQRALQNARNIAANEGRDPNAMGFDLDQQGNVVLRNDPSPETLDLVKRGFDDVISDYRDPTSGRLNLNDQGRAIEGLRQRFVGEVDNLYPNYADARRAYAGPAGEREALQTGRDMANANPRDIFPRMQGMTPGQQGQFRLGQRVAMSDKIDQRNLSGNPYESIYGSPMARERAATVFGRPQADNFQAAYEAERRMAETTQEALGGSQTAPRLAADEAFDNNFAAGAEGLGTLLTGGGGLGDLARSMFRGVRDNYRVGASRRRADELAPLLLNTDPAVMARVIQELRSRSTARNNYVQRTRKAGGIFGASVGSAALPPAVQ